MNSKGHEKNSDCKITVIPIVKISNSSLCIKNLYRMIINFCSNLPVKADKAIQIIKLYFQYILIFQKIHFVAKYRQICDKILSDL